MAKGQRQFDARPALLRGPRLGSLIGAIFGLVYLEVNAGPLPTPAPSVLRLAAAAAFAGLVILGIATLNPQRPGSEPPGAEEGAAGGFG